ncbi:hypothetical protein T265_04501 [Opisthorchis viverrini]|uniref:Uncharacterized protein n=1 Tax=Opisthorchis viverrini TaxID=6198 RepID=A0A074ZSB9_OPIVI|nr:hypothetical protein T265_04501 [Opisthorchis viverrini]KER28712.1 hypothetical protein T265_04501 [Opisthorchis viverrini]
MQSQLGIPKSPHTTNSILSLTARIQHNTNRPHVAGLRIPFLTCFRKNNRSLSGWTWNTLYTIQHLDYSECLDLIICPNTTELWQFYKPSSITDQTEIYGLGIGCLGCTDDHLSRRHGSDERRGCMTEFAECRISVHAIKPYHLLYLLATGKLSLNTNSMFVRFFCPPFQFLQEVFDDTHFTMEEENNGNLAFLDALLTCLPKNPTNSGLQKGDAYGLNSELASHPSRFSKTNLHLDTFQKIETYFNTVEPKT